MVMDSLT